MSTTKVGAASVPPFPGDGEAFTLVVGYAMETVGALARLAEGIVGTQPVVARHVQQLAADVAQRTLGCLQSWPA